MLNGCKSSLSEAETKYLNSNCNDKNFENEVFNYKAEIESLNEKIECEKSKVVDLKSLSKTVEDSINELLNKVKSLFEKVVNLERNLDNEKEYLQTQLNKTIEEKSKVELKNQSLELKNQSLELKNQSLEEKVNKYETLLKQTNNQHEDKSDLRFKNNTSLNESYKRLNDELKFKFKTDKVLKIMSLSLQNLTKAEDDLTEKNNVQQLVGQIERATSNDNLNKKVTDLKNINKINNLKNVAVDFEDNLLNSS